MLLALRHHTWWLACTVLLGCTGPAPTEEGTEPSHPTSEFEPAGDADRGDAAFGDNGAGHADAATAGDAMPDFAAAPDFVPPGRLCDVADDWVAQGGDPVSIPCAIEVRQPSLPAGAAPALLRVVAWNVEFGKDHATVLEQLASHTELARADVLLLSEVARHDAASEPQGIHQAAAIADALGLGYAFAVAWDNRAADDGGGEHGVAVLTRFPMAAMTQIRHTPLYDYYAATGRYGGRTSLGVDLLVGHHVVRVYASHLCLRPQWPDDSGRALQGAEIRADAVAAGRPPIVVVGGDFNTWICNPAIADCTVPPAAEKVVEDFLADGYRDGTAGFNGVTQYGEGFFPQRLDWLFYRGADGIPGIGLLEVDGSDHRPVFTDVILEGG